MTDSARQCAFALQNWLDEPMSRTALSGAREAFDELAACLVKRPDLRDELAPFLTFVFLRTGYLKDYKLLSAFARRVNRPELLEEVDGVVRAELPDVWILDALRRKDVEAAVDCWFEHEEHERSRLCAQALIAATRGRTDVLVSARLRMIAYQIGRGTRSRYRRACRLLETLRAELDRAGESSLWGIALEDLLVRYGHRPALMDELEKAGHTGSSQVSTPGIE